MVWQRQTNKVLTDNPTWASSVYTVVDTIRDCIINEFGSTPTVDAFATKHNKRFKRYWDKTMDAFTRDWSSEPLLWINGPFEYYSRIVDKIINDGARAIIVCPKWERMKWWKRIQKIKTASYTLPLGVKIFQNSNGKPLRPRPWRTVALLVDGKKHDENDTNPSDFSRDDQNNCVPEHVCDDEKQQENTKIEQPQQSPVATTDHQEYHFHYHIYYHPTT